MTNDVSLQRAVKKRRRESLEGKVQERVIVGHELDAGLSSFSRGENSLREQEKKLFTMSRLEKNGVVEIGRGKTPSFDQWVIKREGTQA